MAGDAGPAKMAAPRCLTFSRAVGWKSLGNGRTARMFYSIATIRSVLVYGGRSEKSLDESRCKH